MGGTPILSHFSPILAIQKIFTSVLTSLGGKVPQYWSSFLKPRGPIGTWADSLMLSGSYFKAPSHTHQIYYCQAQVPSQSLQKRCQALTLGLYSTLRFIRTLQELEIGLGQGLTIVMQRERKEGLSTVIALWNKVLRTAYTLSATR